MIHISKYKCVGCGLCIEECVQSSIKLNETGYCEIDSESCSECKLCVEICPVTAIQEIETPFVVALGTDGSGNVNIKSHFGDSKEYLVYEFINKNAIYKKTIINPKFIENHLLADGDPKKAQKVSQLLKGVDVVVSGLYGPNIKRIKKKFVSLIIRGKNIEASIEIIKESSNEIIAELSKENKKVLILFSE